MFFSKLARILAVIAFVVGLLSALLGTAAVMGSWGSDEIVRYFTPGKGIDRGIYAVLFAVALGTLAEIGFSVHRWSTV
jgi:hypothetical protein